MQYNPQGCPESGTALEAKHALYTEIPQFTLVVESYQTLDTIFEGLMKINTPESLKIFIASFEVSNADTRGINQGQLNMTRQNLKMQNLMSDSINLTTAL